MSAEVASGSVAPVSGGPASTGTILVAPEMEAQSMHVKEVPGVALTPPQHREQRLGSALPCCATARRTIGLLFSSHI